MDPKTEIEREVRQEGGGVACFTLKSALDVKWLPLNLPDDVWRVVSAIAYSLDTKYHKRVFICVRGLELEASIDNECAHHIDVCMSACMGAFETLGRDQEGYVSACHDSCRRIVKKDAYDSLHETYLKLTEELKKMGYKYMAKFDEWETPPQGLRVTVWLD